MDRRSFLTWIGLGWLASTTPMLCSSLKQRQTAEGLVFYISIEGNDAWSGKLSSPNEAKTDGPWASLERARDEIRQLKRQQGYSLKQSVTVLLRTGTYFVGRPVIFTPEDSGTENFPITYKAYPGEKPVISGGQLITGWQQQGNLWVAKLPEVKAGKWFFRLLRVGDDWAIRARYPKLDSQQPLTGGWLFTSWWFKPGENTALNVGVGNIHNAGDKLKWQIVVPVTSEYRVWLRYAQHMKEPMDNRTVVNVGSGNPIPLRNLPDTSAWDKFRWTLAATIKLPAGKQTLVWENIKGGGLNLDAFCLTNDVEWNPEKAVRLSTMWGDYELDRPKQGKQLIVVQAEAFNESIGPDISRSYPELAGNRERIVISPDKFPKWKDWDGAEVHIFPAWGWVNAILPVKEVDKQSHTLIVNSQQDIKTGNRFFISNVREALENPGEWCLDRKTGQLLYWPSKSDSSGVEVIAPIIDRLIVLQGNAQSGKFVEHIHFSGLTLIDTDYTLTDNYYTPADAAIWLSAARRCVVEECNFINLGGYAVRLENRSHENEIFSNTMTNLGQGGVILVDEHSIKGSENLPAISTQPFKNLIAANDIKDCGQVYKHVAGIYVTTGSENWIAYNRIQGTPRYGISLKSLGENYYSHKNIIEFNEILDTNLETHDTGAIETFELKPNGQSSGNIIRFNAIRNVVGMTTTPDTRLLFPYNSWGIYLDNGSSGTSVYGNIVFGTAFGGAFINGGSNNTFENNVFWDGLKYQIIVQPVGSLPMSGNVFRKNIVGFANPNALVWYSWQGWKRDILAECNFNIYWNTGGLDLEKTTSPITQEGNFAKWQSAGFDTNSIIDNPLFINWEKGDFRLQPTSPALKLGFAQIPLERIGPQGFTRMSQIIWK